MHTPRALRTPRMNVLQAAPEPIKLLRAAEAYLHQTSLGERLADLIKMRASQINGCAFCLDMHSKSLRRGGESEQRIYLLDAWRESPLYSDRERAALAWTESLTRIAETHAPDEVYEEVRRAFDDRELTDLTILIGMINLWNRVSIAARTAHPVDPA